MAMFGVAMPIFNTPTTVMLQEKVDKNYLGRIFGVFGMISTSDASRDADLRTACRCGESRMAADWNRIAYALADCIFHAQ